MIAAKSDSGVTANISTWMAVVTDEEAWSPRSSRREPRAHHTLKSASYLSVSFSPNWLIPSFPGRFDSIHSICQFFHTFFNNAKCISTKTIRVDCSIMSHFCLLKACVYLCWRWQTEGKDGECIPKCFTLLHHHHHQQPMTKTSNFQVSMFPSKWLSFKKLWMITKTTKIRQFSRLSIPLRHLHRLHPRCRHRPHYYYLTKMEYFTQK